MKRATIPISIDAAIMVALALLALLVRVPIAAERKIMPAGDAFNFQHIASQIQYLHYPSKEKRLPTYPLFILVGRTLGFDPIQTSISISLAASTGTVVALYALGRVLQFDRAALAAFLGLSIFEPLLIINGIRPLADALFVFLVATTFFLMAYLMRYPKKATATIQLITGAVLTLLMFTRYEGFLIAGLSAPFLFLKLPWRTVVRIASIPTVAVILWIPAYISIHGSVSGLAYITDATDSSGSFGEVSKIPANLDRLMNGAGWRRVWTYPIEVFETGYSRETITTLLISRSWWVGVLSLIGLPFLVVAGGFAGLTILLSLSGYALLLSWWWVYSRYVAPLSMLFYFSAAGGLTAVMAAIHKVLRRVASPPVWSVVSLLPLLTIPILLDQVPKLHSSALSQAWESNRKGYALYQNLTSASHGTGFVVYPTKEHADATLFLGTLDEPKSARNAHRGLYLSDWPNDTAEGLYDQIKAARARLLIETLFDDRMPELINLLQARGNIVRRIDFAATRWDTLDTEVSHQYELTWP